MKIKEWSWKNLASYGMVKETIKFSPDKGELLLMVAPIGGGKSSALNALDLALFGEVLNKHGKRLSQKNLPNRINGNLEVNAIFETDEEINITRSMENSGAALKAKMLIDKVPYSKANKIDDKVLEKIGFDYKTYKSFISMNVNNFKNFISLTPEDKRILLDKLFNLEIINELNNILKQLKKQNDLSFNAINGEIKLYRENVQDLEDTIKSVMEKNKDDKSNQLTELKTAMALKKPLFEALETKKTELEDFLDELKTGMNGLSTKIRDIDRDIKEINVKIDLFKSGKCPTCCTELIGELNLLPEFTERLNKTVEIRDKLKKKESKALDAHTETREKLSEINKQYNSMLQFLTETKAQIGIIKNVVVTDLSGFEKNVESINEKIENKESEYLEVQKLKYIYDILSPIWGELGIKRDIIDSIIGPLNEFIAEDLIHLRTRFTVELDNNFDAHITEWNVEIDPDTLSTGEAKEVNLVIMLAYIKMLRMKRDINVLILDEVFASVDISSIKNLLILFKRFANIRKINIILVHHAELDEHFFDRVFIVNKGTFSSITEKIINI